MSVEITEEGKKVTFGFRCPVCNQKWRADATDCLMVDVDDEGNPYGTMACENCGTHCDSTNSVSDDAIRNRCEKNNKLFAMAQDILDNGYDAYSYVASKIFDKDYDACLEYYENGERNPDGKMMRDIAKRICVNTKSVADLEEQYRLPYLGQLIQKAFPFTFPDELEEELDPNFTVLDSTTFIVQLTGYVRFMRFMREQDKIYNKYFKEV